MRRYSDETLDGIMFGLALAANPKLRERRQQYEARLRADREHLATLPRTVLSKAIADRGLWTIPKAFERSTFDMVDAISRCMQGKDRGAWLTALGQGEWRSA